MRGNLSSTFSTNNIQYWKSCKKDSSGEDMKLQCLNSHLCLRGGSGFGIVWLKRSAAKFQAKGWTPQWYLYFLWDTHVESQWQAQWVANTNWHKKGTACDSHASWPRQDLSIWIFTSSWQRRHPHSASREVQIAHSALSHGFLPWLLLLCRFPPLFTGVWSLLPPKQNNRQLSDTVMQVHHLLSCTAFLGWQTELWQAAGSASMNSNNNLWQTINPWQLPRHELVPGMLGKADQGQNI